MAGEEDEDMQLSASTLAALKEFYTERDAQKKDFEDLKAKAESDSGNQDISIEMFEEDWNASQFWYTDATATRLAKTLLEGADSGTSIAIVSAPSVFIKLKRLLGDIEKENRPRACLLEYDERFNVFPEFVFYDFAQPLKLDGSLRGQFDRILCDPPFLSEDCQTKTAITARWLSRSWSGKEQRTIVCTGERMEDLITRLYEKIEVHTTEFLPEHTKGLSNEFRCYANVEIQPAENKADSPLSRHD